MKRTMTAQMPETILINVTLSILVHLPSEFELLQTA